MNLALRPSQEEFIRECVASGRFRTPEEVIGEGLRLLGANEQEEREALRAALLADLDEGLASLERGEGSSGEEVFARLRERYAR